MDTREDYILLSKHLRWVVNTRAYDLQVISANFQTKHAQTYIHAFIDRVT